MSGLKQKGASGIIAEYVAAQCLSNLLSDAGYTIKDPPQAWSNQIDDAIQRVGNDLSILEIDNACESGAAIAKYLFEQIQENAFSLAIRPEIFSAIETIEIVHTGSNTNSGSTSDIQIRISSASDFDVVDVSLKVYRGSAASLGSKSAIASLAQVFGGVPKMSDKEFIERFGEEADGLVKCIKLFKDSAKDFYKSEVGRAFTAEYLASRPQHNKVNNPLRRKELGAWFLAQHGYVSEHRIMQHYAAIFNQESAIGLTADSLRAFEFLLGNPKLLTVGTTRKSGVLDVYSSIDNHSYVTLNRILKPGVIPSIATKAASASARVQLSLGGESVDLLTISVWKDGTIQYKLES